MLDYLAIFKKLNEKGIRYIVVGGIAVNLYGITEGQQDEADIRYLRKLKHEKK